MKTFLIIVTVVLAFSMIMPSAGHAWGRHHPAVHVHYGWGPAAIIAGTWLTGALVLGAISRASQPPQQPAVVYVQPGATVYATPAPPPPATPYSNPNPTFDSGTGEWVTVPGQWVNGTWVPQHTVFVPRNP
ncbi:MAG TPA: hypothetical protein VHO84_03050 [Syntrophorhabdaceae bacterium]|nr:hypothetical protein [Syntrophorhabdaceae bacterium]